MHEKAGMDVKVAKSLAADAAQQKVSELRAIRESGLFHEYT